MRQKSRPIQAPEPDLKDLPRDKRLCTLVEMDRFCEECNTTLVSVGEEFVRTEIEFIPAKVRVIDYYRETFECRTCRKDGKPYMEKSPMPDPLIQHSMASPSTVAWSISIGVKISFEVFEELLRVFATSPRLILEEPDGVFGMLAGTVTHM